MHWGRAVIGFNLIVHGIFTFFWSFTQPYHVKYRTPTIEEKVMEELDVQFDLYQHVEDYKWKHKMASDKEAIEMEKKVWKRVDEKMKRIQEHGPPHPSEGHPAFASNVGPPEQ